MLTLLANSDSIRYKTIRFFFSVSTNVGKKIKTRRQRNDEKNLRVLFERVLEKGAMPPDKARPIWERFIRLDLCLARTGGSLNRVENVETRMHKVGYTLYGTEVL